MTSMIENPLDALAGLLEERRRYEGWLAQLDARRGETPEHVVQRVRGDYLARLESATAQLRGRASDLQASARSLRERIRVLAQQESERRDERAETELRTAVGELPEESARSAIAACDEVIAQLTQERSGHAHELSRIEDILALVGVPSVRPEAEPPPVTTAEIPIPAARREPAPLAAEQQKSALEELAFLQTVVASRGPVSAAPAAAPSSFAPTAAPSSFAPAAAPSHVTTHAPSAAVPPAPTAAPEMVAAPDGARRGPERDTDLLPQPVLNSPRRPVTPLSTAIPPMREPFAGAPKGSTLTPGSIPSFFKDMPTEQVKTLKCQECGTMNYPTEWYCERCGGELAAM